ncbi:hypothetical protein CPT03_20030 [Pedobacter ginsengisoli]|uniref:DUF748 domain-containing protein n=1 Tax=Pedobacter ginsengisoli TaxID=363852 RepID=A0A2D1UAE8_9SPHI|nr:hypothetical protein [Pedobacter ginsengisoli]ATP58590.1 hypothetical protein CPT03_20030 [Pedobacter ginsengisoli]
MVQNKAGKYRLLKWIGGVLGGLILIIAGVALYFSAKWKPLLTEKIKDGVYNGSQKLYTINFKDIHLNLITGSAVLDSVTLTPDTTVFNQLKELKLAPANLFQIKLARLQLTRIGVLTAYFKKQVVMNSIVLEQPSINMIHYKVKKIDSAADERSLYDQISKTLKSIHVKAIKIVDADFDYINGATSKPLNSIKHLNVNIKDLLIDSLSKFDTTRFYYTKDIGFELTGYKSTGKDKMYTLKIDTVAGSVKDKSIRVKGLQMIPLYPDLEFSRKYQYGKDRYDLTFNEIALAGVDFTKLSAEGNLYARILKIGPAKAAIFVNRELPPPPNFDKAHNFPHVALKRLPIQTIVDTVKLTNIDVAYTEYNPITQKRGTVYFQNLSGNILNLTNDSLQVAKNNHAVANLTALVMKTSRIRVAINFNLTDKNASFTYKGNVAPMNMMVLNPMAKNMGLVEIESGQMQGTDFDIQANVNGASGIVHFYYKDLKIKLLKEGENGGIGKKKGFLSFLANSLLIEDANPSKGEAPRTARITFQRTPAASFFNLLWKGVFVGMRETVGLGIVPVKTPEEAMEKVKDKKQERREKREERRKERAEKRAEKKKTDT